MQMHERDVLPGHIGPGKQCRYQSGLRGTVRRRKRATTTVLVAFTAIKIRQWLVLHRGVDRPDDWFPGSAIVQSSDDDRASFPTTVPVRRCVQGLAPAALG